MDKIEKCPVCSGSQFGKFIDFGSVPQSGVFLSAPHQNRKMLNLSFEYCKHCAFIRQRPADSLRDYAGDRKKTGHTMPPYSSEIVGYLHKNGIKNSGLIAEIGSNDGAFLDILSKSGFSNLVGIEPSVFCAEICRSKGYKIENAYFNMWESEKFKEKYGLASAVICRHVIEHIPNIPEFMASAKNLLKEGGVIFIETPYSDDLLFGLRVDELWDQHLSYFTRGNLEMLVGNAGFSINEVAVKPYIGEKTILIFGSANKNYGSKQKECGSELTACRDFSKNLDSLRNKVAAKISNSRKPIFCLGASHPQTNFLVFSGIGGCISKLIDDDPSKAGKYVCVPEPLPIITTEDFLKSSPSGAIIHAAFGYDSWLGRIKTSLKKDIEIIKPYELD